MTAPAQGPKATLYHSELSKLGAVVALIKSAPMQSRYAGRPDYVLVEIDGAIRTLNCETPAISETLGQFAGQTVQLRASGSRDTAILEVFDLEGNPLTDAAAAGPPPAPAARPPAPAPARAPAAAPRAAAPAPVRAAAPARAAVAFDFGRHQRKCENMLLEALKSAVKVAERIEAERGLILPPPELQALASTFFIQWSREVQVFNAMPDSDISDDVPMGNEPTQEAP